MNTGLVFGFWSLSSVAFGFIPELDLLGNIEKSLNMIINSDVIGTQNTNMDNPSSTVDDCYNNGSPYEEDKIKLVARLKRMVRCRRGQEREGKEIETEKLVGTEKEKFLKPVERIICSRPSKKKWRRKITFYLVNISKLGKRYNKEIS